LTSIRGCRCFEHISLVGAVEVHEVAVGVHAAGWPNAPILGSATIVPLFGMAGADRVSSSLERRARLADTHRSEKWPASALIRMIGGPHVGIRQLPSTLTYARGGLRRSGGMCVEQVGEVVGERFAAVRPECLVLQRVAVIVRIAGAVRRLKEPGVSYRNDQGGFS